MAFCIVLCRATGQGFAGNAFHPQFIPTLEACLYPSLVAGRATFCAVSSLALINQTAKELKERIVQYKCKIIDYVGFYDEPQPPTPMSSSSSSSGHVHMTTRLHTVVAAEVQGQLRAVYVFTFMDFHDQRKVTVPNIMKEFHFDVDYKITDEMSSERMWRYKFRLEQIIQRSRMTAVRLSDVKPDESEFIEWYQSQLRDSQPPSPFAVQSSFT